MTFQNAREFTTVPAVVIKIKALLAPIVVLDNPHQRVLHLKPVVQDDSGQIQYLKPVIFQGEEYDAFPADWTNEDAVSFIAERLGLST